MLWKKIFREAIRLRFYRTGKRYFKILRSIYDKLSLDNRNQNVMSY